MQHFAWTPAGTVGRPLWKAVIPEGAYEIEQRPFYVTQDGKGRVVDDLFA